MFRNSLELTNVSFWNFNFNPIVRVFFPLHGWIIFWLVSPNPVSTRLSNGNQYTAEKKENIEEHLLACVQGRLEQEQELGDYLRIKSFLFFTAFLKGSLSVT